MMCSRLEGTAGICACRNTNSHVQMMRSAEKWRNKNATTGMYCSRRRRVFVDRKVRASLVIVGRVRSQQMAEMPLAEHDNVVKTFPPDRTDRPFTISVLPRRSRRGWSIPNAHRPKAADEDVTVDGVAVTNDVSRRYFPIFLAREAIWQLLPSWTAIGVLLWQIDKVLLAEAAIRLGARRLRLGQSYRDAGLVAREDLQAAESSRDRQRPRASRSGEQPSPAWHARCQRYNPANTRRSMLMKVSRCGDLRPSTLSG